MSVVTRGVKNAFRSGIRTTAVVLILAISMGLALSMLLANHAVNDRLTQVKQSLGTTITINPAGSMDFQGGGEPLKTEDIAKIENIDHVKEVNMSLNLMLTTKSEDGSQNQFKAFGGSGLESGETNLVSSIDPGTLGQRFQARGQVNGQEIEPKDIKLPIRLTGVNGKKDEQGKTINLTGGRQLKSDDTNAALVGTNLATKNNLTLGSTFTAYNETFTVVGMFDAGTEFGNDGVYIPLATAQRLSGAGTEISNATVAVDSFDNVDAAFASIKSKLGTDKADVTASEENAATAVESLKSVEKVSIIGFIIALGAAGIIIFLTMLMIVRERRREIGVLKAIGGSNRSIVTQFVVEAIVLVGISSVVGFGVAAVSSNSIAGALVKSNVSSESTDDGPSVSPGGPRGGSFRAVKIGAGADASSAKDLIGNVTTNIEPSDLGYGLAAAIGIAIIGSAIPAWFITKIRPAEVLRGE